VHARPAFGQVGAVHPRREVAKEGDVSAPVRRAYERWREALQAAIEATALIETLAPGDVSAATTTTAWRIANAEAVAEMEAALAAEIAPAARLAGAEYGVSFSMDNPFMIRWLRSQSSTLVTALDQSAVQALREYLALTVERGIPPRLAAPGIAGIVGLRPDQAETLTRYTLGLMAEGKSAAQIERLIGVRSNRMALARGTMIARTELTSAAAVGTEQSWLVAQQAGAISPYSVKVWDARLDGRQSAICEALDGTMVPLGTAFPGGYMAPSAHPNCRSGLQLKQLSKREFERLIETGSTT
jgi:hypothetical protein